jgi:Cu+-exporting ATPase
MRAESAAAPGSALVTAATTNLVVSGMNCANCARHVSEAVQGVPGVASVAVHLEQGRATVRWVSGRAPALEEVLAAVAQAGYPARPAGDQPAEASPPSPLAVWRFNVIFGAVLTVPLLIGEWVLGLGEREGFKWLGFALAAPVMAVCGRGFFRGAWQQLRRGGSNMDTLVSLGSSTAFGFSLWGLLTGWPGHLYFMEAAAIITLISTGHWLEALATARAGSALRSLMDLTPPTARRLDPAGCETSVPVAELRADDRVILKPGDRVPVDGEVTEGSSAVEESMLTGESRPVEKGLGARLFAGTLNRDGRLLMRVTATGEATALAQIIAVVQRAQGSRANIQKLGDKVSSVFVPAVVLLAVATAFWWGFAYDHARHTAQFLGAVLWPVHLPGTALAAAFIHAAAVLIVACPCAMGLATPAAIMAGTNAAARRGILIRDGVALEKSGRITAVLFDKTGTLTQGELAVTAFQELRASRASGSRASELAVALARPSSHPLSQAIAALAANAPSAPVSGQDAASSPSQTPTAVRAFRDWREVRGSGVEAAVEGMATATWRLGSLSWLQAKGVDTRAATAFVERWANEGATVLGLAEADELLGMMALRDVLKAGAAEVVRQLRGAGHRVFLVTGDQRATALAIAAQAGIAPDDVFPEVRPEHKAQIVQALQQRGERVAFVGDGINDAPALEQSDLGVAVSQASDVAREAADLILLNSDLQAIPAALGLAQATLRTIRQNLFWAFFYNAAAVPLAALGFLSPVVCALAMGLSDLIVIGNALRLRRWRQ